MRKKPPMPPGPVDIADRAGFAQRMVLAMVLSPRPTSVLSRRWPPVLPRPTLRPRGRRPAPATGSAKEEKE